jgi:hypothetical protein
MDSAAANEAALVALEQRGELPPVMYAALPAAYALRYPCELKVQDYGRRISDTVAVALNEIIGAADLEAFQREECRAAREAWQRKHPGEGEPSWLDPRPVDASAVFKFCQVRVVHSKHSVERGGVVDEGAKAFLLRLTGKAFLSAEGLKKAALALHGAMDERNDMSHRALGPAADTLTEADLVEAAQRASGFFDACEGAVAGEAARQLGTLMRQAVAHLASQRARGRAPQPPEPAPAPAPGPALQPPPARPGQADAERVFCAAEESYDDGERVFLPVRAPPTCRSAPPPPPPLIPLIFLLSLPQSRSPPSSPRAPRWTWALPRKKRRRLKS